MGARCCKPNTAPGGGDAGSGVSLSELDQHVNAAFAPLGPHDMAQYYNAPPHIFILGPQSVGKTSLFVRLTYPEIPEEDAIAVVSETSTFHTEAFSLYDRKCFLWDVSIYRRFGSCII
eukprot:Protomagalhaensia_wolfi_Nauph_80__6259@NODE_954_length_1854_cov_13_162534_g721_i0_p2_GENE_NODE_954_length_1854_cov_13_162534_g721_i0NODE_954_length_1854_cov_13_162534_g721_i0_p2_ORF_typecomplete_len118_score0_91Arf/PF00025_21/0_00054Roc/PF08477_13/0_0008Ras/PF00071_22/0_0014SRPRB/PF09439_10/0_0047MMR_HSR1/PF01926_23/0_019AAA_28/PF13521_6/0_029AAA_35/PF14516_6/0_045ATPase_2/PF01637_18/0_056PduVEutP/PF10662_9/0_15FeoB_N/PF02421_18/0_17TniB/PF05621_11/0_18_NODE_954_length_1854_cov_13_162534_g721_i0